MTPVSRFIERFLPTPMNWLALAAIYAFMSFAVVAHAGYVAPANIYVDIGR